MAGFLDMGGYSFFVWGSYGAAFLFFVGLYIATRKDQKRADQQICTFRSEKNNAGKDSL